MDSMRLLLGPIYHFGFDESGRRVRNPPKELERIFPGTFVSSDHRVLLFRVDGSITADSPVGPDKL